LLKGEGRAVSFGKADTLFIYAFIKVAGEITRAVHWKTGFFSEHLLQTLK